MKSARLAIAALAICVSASAWSNPPKNSEFQKLTDAQKRWWYIGSITTLGHVVALESSEKAKCVWDWYFDAPERREAQMDKSFTQYPDHAPSSIVIALLRRDCGVFPKAAGG